MSFFCVNYIQSLFFIFSMALRNVWSQKINSPVGLRFESLEKQFVAFCFFFHTVSLDCVHCVCDRGVRRTMRKPYKPQRQRGKNGLRSVYSVNHEWPTEMLEGDFCSFRCQMYC